MGNYLDPDDPSGVGAPAGDDEAAADAAIPDDAAPDPDAPDAAPDPDVDPRAVDGVDGDTLPVESDGTLLEAPAAAVLDPGPDPITPGASQQAYHDRVKYEDQVNAQIESWIATNRAAITDAFIAGGTVELNVSLPGDDAADDDTAHDPDEDLVPKS